MTDKELCKGSLQKLKKQRRSQILEGIREFLGVPDNIPRGGPELKKDLKTRGAKRLRMAINNSMPLYTGIFTGKFTNKKLYDWAENNGKIHKRCLIQSEEAKQCIKEAIDRNSEQGGLKKSLEFDFAEIIKQEDPSFISKKISKSSAYRIRKDTREHDSQQGYKKVKTDSNYHPIPSPENVSTQQHSPDYEESEPFDSQLFGFPLDQYLDVEAFLTRTDVWASSECSITMDSSPENAFD